MSRIHYLEEIPGSEGWARAGRLLGRRPGTLPHRPSRPTTAGCAFGARDDAIRRKVEESGRPRR